MSPSSRDTADYPDDGKNQYDYSEGFNGAAI
jgi:hypothetical protein